MSNRRFTQFFNTLHTKPVLLDCNFVVDNTNGLGISSLKGPGIQNVYMNSGLSFVGDTNSNTTIDNIADTSGLEVGMPVSGAGIPVKTTIASIVDANSITISNAATATASAVTIGYAAVGSLNPAVGYAIIQLQDTYNYFYAGYASVNSPNSGSPINISGSSVLTVGNAYVITSVGTSTAANWQAMGLPVGITPAVGVSFIATATGSGTGTGQVQAPLAAGSGIVGVEFIGDPNQTIKSSKANVMGVSSGAYVMLKFNSAAALGTHTHDFIVKGGQAAATTNVAAVYSGPVFGKEAATDATILGANSAASGGVVAASAGTSVLAAAAPANGSLVSIALYLSSSRITVQGE